MKVLCVSQEKGGVGKSTIAAHAAWKLAERGRTLLIDLDQQQAAVSEPFRAVAASVDAIQMFAEPTAVVPVGQLTLASRTRQLEAIEREDAAEMVDTFCQSLRLCGQHYEFVVLDTPPQYGVRVAAAIAGADMVVAPIELNESSLEAVQSVVNTIVTVRSVYGREAPDLTKQRPLLVSRFDRHSVRQRALFEELASRVGKIVVEGAIVSRDAYARYRSERLPVWQQRDANGRLSSSIKAASDEIRTVLDEIERMMEVA